MTAARPPWYHQRVATPEPTGPTLLHRAPIFAGLDATAMAALAASATTRGVDCGGAFFRQGDPAHALYVLVDGDVKMLATDAAGHQVVMRVIRRGDMFGCSPVLARGVYPATSEALTDSHAWTWDLATLEALMERFPRLAHNALKVVGGRLLELQDRLLEVATERVEQRLARTLLRLVRQAGRRAEGGGVEIDLPLSRQDLAELSGTTLFTVSRTLSRWESVGLVAIGRKRVVIRDNHGVVAIAEDLER